MKTLSFILSNPKKSFSSLEVAEALRTTQGAVQKWIDRSEIRFEKVAGRYIIRGEWVREYLVEKQGGGFFSLAEIMKNYELPADRDEK